MRTTGSRRRKSQSAGRGTAPSRRKGSLRPVGAPSKPQSPLRPAMCRLTRLEKKTLGRSQPTRGKEPRRLAGGARTGPDTGRVVCAPGRCGGPRMRPEQAAGGTITCRFLSRKQITSVGGGKGHEDSHAKINHGWFHRVSGVAATGHRRPERKAELLSPAMARAWEKQAGSVRREGSSFQPFQDMPWERP